MTDCFICEKHEQGDATQGGVIFEDDLIYVGHIHARRRPTAYRGYLFVEPKRHVSDLGDLTELEAASMGRTVNTLARVLRETFGAEHVYCFILGDAEPHLHAHVAPRYPGTPTEYWGARVREWPEAPQVNIDEMRALAREIAAAIA